MTLNNVIDLFKSIQVAHYQLKGFGFGNLFEINGNIKPGLNYPLLWVVPINSITTDQTKQRRFLLLVVSLVKKDMSNRDDVWSDCEQILDDVIKILKNESDDYDLKNEPEKTPVAEEHGDWVTGWQAEIALETELNSNYCDVPADGLNVPVTIPGFATIKNTETGEIVRQLKRGETYYITILDTIEQSLDTVTPTIIQVLT
jgi:hypothetical protein